LDLRRQSICSINHGSLQPAVSPQTALITLDEATMEDKYAYHAVSRILSDIGQNSGSFSRITMTFLADFRKCLPVVPGSSQSQMVYFNFPGSNYWPQFHVLQLEENVHLIHT
ncbi:hypothetical protein C7212DRAFT_118532, partial [Tuber magnatum]